MHAAQNTVNVATIDKVKGLQASLTVQMMNFEWTEPVAVVHILAMPQ